MIEHRTACGLSYCYRYDRTGAKARCLETWGEYIGAQDPALETPLPVRPNGRDNRKVKGINYVRLSYFAKARYSEAENGRGAVERFFGDPSGRVVKHVTRSGAVLEQAFDPVSGDLSAYSDFDGTQHKIPRTPDGTPTAYEGPLKAMARFLEDDGTEVEFDSTAFAPKSATTRGATSSSSRTVTARSRSPRTIPAAYKPPTRTAGAASPSTTTTHREAAGIEINEYDFLGRRISFCRSLRREDRVALRPAQRGRLEAHRRRVGDHDHPRPDAEHAARVQRRGQGRRNTNTAVLHG